MKNTKIIKQNKVYILLGFPKRNLYSCFSLNNIYLEIAWRYQAEINIKYAGLRSVS